MQDLLNYKLPIKGMNSISNALLVAQSSQIYKTQYKRQLLNSCSKNLFQQSTQNQSNAITVHLISESSNIYNFVQLMNLHLGSYQYQTNKIRPTLMANLQDIHNSSLNNSTSKQQYSFSKGERFKRILKTQHIDVFYDLPSSIDKNTYSFSKGRRYKDICQIRKKHSPQPPFYQLEGEFQKILKKRSGIKMSYGRQECKAGSIFKLSDNPGPGAYDPNPQFTQSRVSVNCSLGKINSTKRRVQNQVLPGPGNYDVKSSLLDQNKILSSDTKRSAGKLFFSTHKLNIRVRTQVQPQIRFPEITYRGDRTIKKNVGHSLAKAVRFKTALANDTPGPGSYKKFSEFLESSKK